MDRQRNLGPQPQPCWTRQLTPVDQYSFGCPNYVNFGCQPGLSTPTYNCQGNISFSLPLTRYPNVMGRPNPSLNNAFMSKGMCSPFAAELAKGMRQDLQSGRLSSFYYRD